MNVFKISRLKAGMTVERLSKETRLKPERIIEIENWNDITIKEMVVICDVLETNIDFYRYCAFLATKYSGMSRFEFLEKRGKAWRGYFSYVPNGTNFREKKIERFLEALGNKESGDEKANLLQLANFEELCHKLPASLFVEKDKKVR